MSVNRYDPDIVTEYPCHLCKVAVPVDDCLWVDLITGRATTGEMGAPFHEGCAPPESEADMVRV